MPSLRWHFGAPSDSWSTSFDSTPTPPSSSGQTQPAISCRIEPVIHFGKGETVSVSFSVTDRQGGHQEGCHLTTLHRSYCHCRSKRSYFVSTTQEHNHSTIFEVHNTFSESSSRLCCKIWAHISVRDWLSKLLWHTLEPLFIASILITYDVIPHKVPYPEHRFCAFFSTFVDLLCLRCWN